MIKLFLGINGWIANPTTIYVASIYFIVSTLTTVGYGDFNAKTIFEMLFAILVQVRFKYNKLI